MDRGFHSVPGSGDARRGHRFFPKAMTGTSVAAQQFRPRSTIHNNPANNNRIWLLMFSD